MKKIFTLFLSVILIFMISATVSADYRGAVENINMVSGLNPVVNLIEDGKFEYIWQKLLLRLTFKSRA